MKQTPEERRQRGWIKVTEVIGSTGEIIEREVSSSHYKPRSIARPRPKENLRVSPCSAGWSVLHFYDHQERMLGYWEAFSNKLTGDERSAIASDQSSSVLRPVEPKWQKGDSFEVAANVTATVDSGEWTLRGHRTTFRITDRRVLLVKRGAGYTTSPDQAVKEAGGVLDEKLHQRLHAEASAATALRQSTQRIRGESQSLEQRLAEARRKNWHSTVRYLERVREHRKRKEAA